MRTNDFVSLRLAGDVKSYLQEKKTIDTKLRALKLEGADDGEIRRQVQYVNCRTWEEHVRETRQRVCIPFLNRL